MRKKVYKTYFLIPFSSKPNNAMIFKDECFTLLSAIVRGQRRCKKMGWTYLKTFKVK